MYLFSTVSLCCSILLQLLLRSNSDLAAFKWLIFWSVATIKKCNVQKLRKLASILCHSAIWLYQWLNCIVILYILAFLQTILKFIDVYYMILLQQFYYLYIYILTFLTIMNCYQIRSLSWSLLWTVTYIYIYTHCIENNNMTLLILSCHWHVQYQFSYHMMNLYIYQYGLSLSVPFNIMVSISPNESTYHLVISQFAMERSTIFWTVNHLFLWAIYTMANC